MLFTKFLIFAKPVSSRKTSFGLVFNWGGGGGGWIDSRFFFDDKGMYLSLLKQISGKRHYWLKIFFLLHVPIFVCLTMILQFSVRGEATGGGALGGTPPPPPPPHKFSVPPRCPPPPHKNHAYNMFLFVNIACVNTLRPHKYHSYVFLKYALKSAYLTVFMPL